MNEFWKWFTLLILLFAGVAVLTHAYGFSLAAGTMFQGLQGLGGTLEGGNIASGGTKTR